MAGKVKAKAKVRAPQKGTAQVKKGQQQKKVFSSKAKLTPSSKIKSKAVSLSLKKAAQSQKTSGQHRKSIGEVGKTKRGANKQKQAKPKAIASKNLKVQQPAIGKGKLKQVAKELASKVHAKAKKKEEVRQEVARAKSKDVTQNDQKVLAPEPAFEDAVKARVSDTEASPVLTDAEGRPYCKVKDCDQIAVVDGYCRYHYLLLWKKIQVRRKILADGKLERYVEELTARYPDKYLEVIRKDLLNEKNFLAAIAELEIDESGADSDFEQDDTQVIDEVRSFSDTNLIGDDDF